MKKLLKTCALVTFCALGLSACITSDYSSITGYDIIKTAKEKYAALESAHVVITDDDTEKVTQDFVFKYEGDTLTYSYVGYDGSSSYYEFHNGSELDYYDNTSTGWNYLDNASEDYYVYTKSDKNSLTTESVIALNAESIVSGEKTDGENGAVVLRYTYNAEKMNSYSTSLSKLGTIKSFETTFYIDADGYCTRMSQNGVLTGETGDFEVNYTMIISEMNSVEKIVRPEVVSAVAEKVHRIG